MRILKTPLLPVLLALMLSLAAPGLAFAAPARVAAYEVRTGLQSDGTRIMLVSADLAPGVKLPAEVSISVPKGAKISWAGEILGGDPSQDPSAKYATRPGPGYDTIVFTLKQARRGQVELALPAPEVTAAGTRMSTSWTAPEAADAARVAVEVPQGAQIATATPGSSATTANNVVIYSRQFTGVKKGQRLDLEVVYTGGATAAVPQQQSQPAAPVSPSGQPASPVIIVLALAVILAGTFFALDRVKRSEAPQQR